MGLLDTIIAKTKGYIAFTDAVELIAIKENISVGNVARALLHYDIQNKIPFFRIDDRYVIHSESSFNESLDDDRLFLIAVEDDELNEDDFKVSKDINEKFNTYYWQKEQFFNFEPIKELNLADPIVGLSSLIVDGVLERADLELQDSNQLRGIIREKNELIKKLISEQKSTEQPSTKITQPKSISSPPNVDLQLILDTNHPNHAPDLVNSINLWIATYIQNPKKDSHTNKANMWIKTNTGYEESNTSAERIREITSPLNQWSVHRSKNYKKN